jgi:hypothetical protein
MVALDIVALPLTVAMAALLGEVMEMGSIGGISAWDMLTDSENAMNPSTATRAAI